MKAMSNLISMLVVSVRLKYFRGEKESMSFFYTTLNAPFNHNAHSYYLIAFNPVCICTDFYKSCLNSSINCTVHAYFAICPDIANTAMKYGVELAGRRIHFCFF